MINENEIRVCNYYKRIDTVNDSKLGYHKWDSSDWYKVGECIDYFEHYEPIPLTEDILLKCGFKGIALPLYLNTGYFEFVWRKELFLDVEGQWLSINCHYLHQLQNLYFALCGEELKINL